MGRYLFHIDELYGFSIARPLQDAIAAQGGEIRWFLEDPDRLDVFLRPDEKLLRTVAEVKAYNPEAVFVPGNRVPDFFPGVKVELFHGFNANKRNGRRGHFRIRNFFDLYCTQGPDTTVPFQRLSEKCGFFDVVETGWPKMDPLFNGYDTGPEENRRPVVLFASTFTPRLSSAPVLFETIRRLSGTGRWKWRVNLHPKMDSRIVDSYRLSQTDNLELVITDDIIPLLRSADILVSDTSSIISEFMLQIKPVVSFRNRLPGPHLINITDPGALESSIACGLTRPASLMESVRRHAFTVHPYRDGQSSLRVLAAARRLIENGRAHHVKKPLNLIRRAKIRHRLRYYRIF